MFMVHSVNSQQLQVSAAEGFSRFLSEGNGDEYSILST
jgi:hypothetical protein